jgi:hypothetical protein
MHELHVQGAFQLLDQAAERALRDMQSGRGLGEGARLRDGNEGTELSKGHIHRVFSKRQEKSVCQIDTAALE